MRRIPPDGVDGPVSSRPGRGETGQVLPLALLAVLAAAAVLYAATRVGPLLGDAARARTAADAAALAGAAEGRTGAERLAGANGADLVSFERRGPQVVVEVRVGGARASATASGVVDWVAP